MAGARSPRGKSLPRGVHDGERRPCEAATVKTIAERVRSASHRRDDARDILPPHSG